MTKKIKVLLLEPNEAASYRIEFMLINNKYIESVKIAPSCILANEILNKRDTDVVILDIKFLTGANLYFFGQLRVSFPNIKLVILANRADDYQKTYAKRLGIDYFIDQATVLKEIPKIVSQICA